MLITRNNEMPGQIKMCELENQMQSFIVFGEKTRAIMRHQRSMVKIHLFKQAAAQGDSPPPHVINQTLLTDSHSSCGVHRPAR